MTVTRSPARSCARGDAGFDDAAVSRIFNQRRPSRRPAAVLRPADVADVAAGVRLAAAEGLRVAVRAGGHSWAAWSLRDDTLLIDLAAFTGMDYDETTGTVTVGPAVRGGLDLDPFLAAPRAVLRRRALPDRRARRLPAAGRDGLELPGLGLGGRVDRRDPGGDRLRRRRVVLGEENADLFWAARGSGPGFFGVVTAFRLRTRPRYRELTQTTYVYPPSVAAEVLALAARRAARRAVVGRAGRGRHHPAATRRRLGHSRARAGGGRGQLRRRARRRCARSTPARSRTGRRREDRPAGHHRRAARRAGARQPRGTPLHGRQRLPGRAARDTLIPALTPAFTDLPTAKSFSLWFDLAHLPARPLSADGAARHGAVRAERPLLRHLRRRRDAGRGRTLPVLAR